MNYISSKIQILSELFIKKLIFIIMNKSKTKKLLKTFVIVKTEKIDNNNGYGYLRTTKNKHYLSNGTYLIESTDFSSSKARSIECLNYYTNDGNLIKRYIE